MIVPQGLTSGDIPRNAVLTRILGFLDAADKDTSPVLITHFKVALLDYRDALKRLEGCQP